MKNVNKNYKDLTILILNNNRTSTLERNLSFINSYKIRLKILILDSSIKKKNLKIFENYKLDIKYLHFNYKTSFHAKIFKSLKYINTKFCLLVSDDDFFLIDSLQHGISFLKKNKNFSTVSGNTYIHQDYQRVKKKIFFLQLISNSLKKSNDSKSKSERVKNFLSGKIQQNLYSITRTKDFKKTQKIIHKFTQGRSAGQYDEMISNAISLCLGKSKFLEIFYCSREPNYSKSKDYLIPEKKHIYYYKKFNKKFIRLSLSLVPKVERSRFKRFLENETKTIFHRYIKVKFYRKNLNLINSLKVVITSLYKIFSQNYMSNKTHKKKLDKIKKFILLYPKVKNEIIYSRNLRKKHFLRF